MIPEYSYRVKDFSIITPWFRDYVVQPLMRFVPWWLPANIITIISNSMMFLALAIALFWPATCLSYITIAVLIFLYAVGDHIDGMQAKRTKTSSALGELFDHFLDSFNTGILLIILFAVFGIDNPYTVLFILSINYLAHAAVFYEQFKTGWLYFEKIGSLEVVIFSSLIILANCIAPINVFLTQRIGDWNISVVELLFLFSAVGTFVTFFITAFRARIAELNFYLFLVMLVILSVILMSCVSWVILSVIITLYCAYYIGSLMRGHLVDGNVHYPDFITPGILILAYFTGYLAEHVTILAVIAILIIEIVSLFIFSIYTLRQYWVWKNPRIN